MLKPHCTLLMMTSLIWLIACRAPEQQKASTLSTVPIATPLPSATVINGLQISVVKAERVKKLVDDKANVEAGPGQDFLKVTLAVSGASSKSPLDEFGKIQLRFVESNGAESGPAFNWRFEEKANSTLRIYSYPKPIMTIYQGIKVENVLLGLPAK